MHTNCLMLLRKLWESPAVRMALLFVTALAAIVVVKLALFPLKPHETGQDWFFEHLLTPFTMIVAAMGFPLLRRQTTPPAVRSCLAEPDSVVLLALDGTGVPVFDPSYRPKKEAEIPSFRGIPIRHEVAITEPCERRKVAAMVDECLSAASEYLECLSPPLAIRHSRGPDTVDVVYSSDGECAMVFHQGLHIKTCCVSVVVGNLSLPGLLQKIGHTGAQPVVG